VPTLAVLVLVAVMLVQAASWRMMARTLQADEPARLVMLVGLERSLEALRDAVVERGGDAPVDNVAAARAAVVERLDDPGDVRPVGPWPLPGRRDPIEVWRLA
jgi:hypothetical protein